MHSELFTLFGLHIQMYGIMLAIGFACCYFLARCLARSSGRNVNEIDTIILVAAVCGIVGARLVYVFQNWQMEFAQQPLQVFALWKGGLVFYGGFLLAVIGLIVYAVLKHERILELLGFCVVFVPLGQAFGRIGCFFHGCCFGRICNNGLGIRFPARSPAWLHQQAMGQIGPYAAHTLPVWPTQLMEAMGCFLLFCLLWLLYRRVPKTLRAARCCGIYLICYALLRFGIECLRDDPRGSFYLMLSFSQWVSIMLIILGFVFLVLSWEKTDGSNRR